MKDLNDYIEVVRKYFTENPESDAAIVSDLSKSPKVLENKEFLKRLENYVVPIPYKWRRIVNTEQPNGIKMTSKEQIEHFEQFEATSIDKEYHNRYFEDPDNASQLNVSLLIVLPSQF